MLYTTRNILCVSTAIGVWIILSKWSTITGMRTKCGTNEYWDINEDTCSTCTKKACEAFGETQPKECHCVCSPDSRECRSSPEFNPSELTTKSETQTHREWLIAITVILIFNTICSGLFIGFILWYVCKYIISTQGVQDQAGLEDRVQREIRRQLNNPGLRIDNDGNADANQPLARNRPAQPVRDNDGNAGDERQGLMEGRPIQLQQRN